jgi:mRNA-degrading endonuclease RelE of RelBE toxin-antitoxin system
MSYRVVIPPELSESWQRLAPTERLPIQVRLEQTAEAASVVANTPPPHLHWLELAAISPGEHRVFVGGQWVAYCLCDEEHTLRLMDFGSWSSTPLAPHAAPAAEWRSAGQQEEGWDNEGGCSLHLAP